MQYLLERISARPYGRDGKPEAFDLEAAILAQLQRILASARQAEDAVAVVPWGMRPVVEIGRSHSVDLKRYADAFAEAIARHEPRLREVQVEVEPDPDGENPFRLVVSAIFPDESNPRRVRVAAPV